MVFQSGALFDSLTVGENVGFLLYEHSDLPRDTVKVRPCTLKPRFSYVSLPGLLPWNLT